MAFENPDEAPATLFRPSCRESAHAVVDQAGRENGGVEFPERKGLVHEVLVLVVRPAVCEGVDQGDRDK